MLKLYFGNIQITLSTLLAVDFAVFFAVVSVRQGSISHRGILVLKVVLTETFQILRYLKHNRAQGSSFSVRASGDCRYLNCN